MPNRMSTCQNFYRVFRELQQAKNQLRKDAEGISSFSVMRKSYERTRKAYETALRILAPRALEEMGRAGEIFYISPREMRKGLQEIDMDISDEEIARMERLLLVDIKQVRAQCSILKSNTVKEKAPLVMVLPRTVLLRDKKTVQEISLCIHNLTNVWSSLVARTDCPEMEMHAFAGAEVQLRLWGDSLKAFSVDNMEGSIQLQDKNVMPYLRTLSPQLQQSGADAFLAFAITFLVNGTSFDQETMMRIREKSADGYDLFITIDSYRMGLLKVDGITGISASCSFSALPSAGM